MLFITCKSSLSLSAPFLLERQGEVDGVELRLDLFPSIDFTEISSFRAAWKKKILLTLRTKQQGGGFEGTESVRYQIWTHLLSLQPDYVDIEYDAPTSLIDLVAGHPSKPKLILSYHNFLETPDLKTILEQLRTCKADVYKIATYARSSNDSLRMLQLMKYAKQDRCCLIGICMGDLGQITRVLSPVAGGYLTFACINQGCTAEGQIDIDDLLYKSRFKMLGPATKVFGLIGHPIEKSLSPVVHNQVWNKNKQDAFYVNISLKKAELEEFFSLVRYLDFFHGFSVTMPLKELVAAFLDRLTPLAHMIGAVNTIYIDELSLIGDNTDMQGAIQALENEINLSNKKVVVVGAGGAAAAIAMGCIQKGSKVFIASRSFQKAHLLASKLGCESIELNCLLAFDYDILINATPTPMPIAQDHIKKGSCIMDINTNPIETALLLAAKEKQCICIAGWKMFMHQAIAQQILWSRGFYEESHLKAIMEPLLEERASLASTP